MGDGEGDGGREDGLREHGLNPPRVLSLAYKERQPLNMFFGSECDLWGFERRRCSMKLRDLIEGAKKLGVGVEGWDLTLFTRSLVRMIGLNTRRI